MRMVAHWALPMKENTMPTITPSEAANRSGKSRRTIMRAIMAGEINARRDNRNQWQIGEDALAHWARPSETAHVAYAENDTLLNERIRGLERLLNEVQSVNDTLRVANDDLRTDRDRWHALALRPWWKRLTG